MDIQPRIQYLCMNPNCPQPGLKFIGIQDIQKHKQCNGWVVEISEMQKILNPVFPKTNQPHKNFFYFKGEPLKSLFDINKLFFAQEKIIQSNNTDKSLKNPLYNHGDNGNNGNDPIQLLKKEFSQIKLKIQVELEKIYTQVETRILEVKNVQETTINEIRRILTTIDTNEGVSKQIQKSQILKKYHKFCQKTDSFTIIDQQKINKQIFKILQFFSNISSCFWKTQLESVKLQKQLFEKTFKQIERFHKDQTIHSSFKLQSLQNMFQQKPYQTFYSEDKTQVWVKCWVCGSQQLGQGKSLKERRSCAYENLVNHVTRVHVEETTSKFAVQMIKSSTYQLSYNDFLQLLQEKNYKEFIIVDRENMSQGLSSMLNDKINQKILIINVVSMAKINIAFGKYLVSMSKGKDSADTLMIMAIYAIINSGYYQYISSLGEEKRPKISLLTKDHFAETYREILKNDFGVEINVIK